MAGAALSAPAEAGTIPTGWSAGQKAWLWFLAGLGLGVAITTAILLDAAGSSGSPSTGVAEDDTDRGGTFDTRVTYHAFENVVETVMLK